MLLGNKLNEAFSIYPFIFITSCIRIIYVLPHECGTYTKSARGRDVEGRNPCVTLCIEYILDESEGQIQ